MLIGTILYQTIQKFIFFGKTDGDVHNIDMFLWKSKVSLLFLLGFNSTCQLKKYKVKEIRVIIYKFTG